MPAETPRAGKCARIALGLAGTILIAIFFVALLPGNHLGSYTATTKVTTPAATGTITRTTATPSATTQAAAAAQPSRTRSTSTGPPSEGVLLALLATGALLIAAGALYGRISTIKLPGGAEIDLSPEEKATIAAQVAKQTPPALSAAKLGPDHAAPMSAAATQAALDIARTIKQHDGQLTTDGIQQAISLGIHQTTATLAPPAGTHLDGAGHAPLRP